jgi:hypothetical protein
MMHELLWLQTHPPRMHCHAFDPPAIAREGEVELRTSVYFYSPLALPIPAILFVEATK